MFGFDLTGSAKLGTGDRNQGLGTGATDYTVELGGYKSFGDFSTNAAVGYTSVGTGKFVRTRKDAWLFSVGASYRIDEAWSVGANFDTGGTSVRSPRLQRTVSGAQTRQLSEDVTYRFSDRWRVQLYVDEGLSTASPDFGGGATVMMLF
jgi:hypothetical protein